MRERNLITRRDLLVRGLTTAAGLSLGIGALPVFGAPTFDTIGLAAKNACSLTCSQTLGPCYYAANLIRQDVREGKAGLPTLLSFLVLDADTCQPVPNASIDIWHTDAGGVYSAPINAMCNPGDALARTQTFCRGIQLTNSDGYAYFNTVFPGWYSGRTTHIHLTVRLSGTEIVTTQFYFDDALTDFIYRNHPSYTSRPDRNTTNTTDNILGGSLTRMAPYIFNTKLIAQRSLVALKVITIRTTATRCNA